jgi:putative ABC transport system ATP-binding protein
MNIIRLENLDRSFMVGDQQVHALDKVNLNIERGDYLSIMGPSGSGKSTLLNIIGLLDKPNAGRYFLDGADTTSASDDEQATLRRQKIGFVFQFFHLIPRLTAQENVALPLVLAGVPAKTRTAQVDAALKAVGLTDRAKHLPEQLSGGQRQRVAIARATITEPAIILADEPTGNLDRHSGSEVINVLEALNKKGITLLVVTHDNEIGSRARRNIHLTDGRIDSDIVTSISS